MNEASSRKRTILILSGAGLFWAGLLGVCVFLFFRGQAGVRGADSGSASDLSGSFSCKAETDQGPGTSIDSSDSSSGKEKAGQNPDSPSSFFDPSSGKEEPDSGSRENDPPVYLHDESSAPRKEHASDASSPAFPDYKSAGLLNSRAASYENEFRIYYLDGVSDAVRKTVEDKLSLVPDLILENVSDNGFMYIVDPSGAHSFGHAGTTTHPDCYVEGRFLALPENIAPPYGEIAINGADTEKAGMAAIHEVGHAVDWLVGTACLTSVEFENNTYMSLGGDPEWQRIYEEEAPRSGFPDHNRTTALEYFAEVFRYVFEDPSRLEKVPQSRAYVEAVLSSYYGLTFPAFDSGGYVPSLPKVPAKN
ncbi:MAG: hypothetical protein K6F53_01060 [Lachnospiraceae bacterium]|nr:hypothetical protein [Lachnospiraceae bacterium]